MSVIIKLPGGMMKGLRRRNFVIENLFTGECKTPGKEKRRDSRSAETETAFYQFLCQKSAVSQLKTSHNCEENLQKPSHVRHL